MNKFLVFIAVVGLAAVEAQYLGLSASQYRYQDEFGQHAFGHVGGPNSREEVRTADGSTRGSYSYVDGHGLVQSAVYAADAANGFRVAATNLPVGPAVPSSPALVAAAPIAAGFAYGSPFAGVHALKKRDVFAVQQLTSYPGSTGPLVRAAPIHTIAHVASPLIASAPLAHSIYATPYATPYSQFAHVLKKRSLPLDEPIVAHAKAAQLISQNTEAIRNTIGGIPLALPADTPEVAAGKQAHAIDYANIAAINASPYAAAHFASPYAAHLTTPYAAHLATPYAHSLASPYAASWASPLVARSGLWY